MTQLLVGCVGTIVMIVVSLAVLNAAIWMLLTFFPYVVIALIVAACLLAGWASARQHITITRVD